MSFLEGTIYELDIPHKNQITIGHHAYEKEAYIAEIQTLPRINIIEPISQAAYSSIIPIKWNTQSNYDSVKVNLNCETTDPQDGQRITQTFVHMLPKEAIVAGEVHVSTDELKALLENTAYSIPDCHTSVRIARHKKGKFLDKDYRLSTAWYSEVKLRSFSIEPELLTH